MKKTVAVISTLDTKAAETSYLKAQIEARGCNALVMDLGTRGIAGIPADVGRDEIFRLGSGGEPGPAIEDRVKLGEIMTTGAGIKLGELYEAGKVHGVIGIGGATNSLMETNIMRVLPFGVPKLMVSSVAASRGLASRYFGASDIAILHSVVDFTGLNDLTGDILTRAAGAIAGMVEKSGELLRESRRGKGLIAMTMLSMCERTAAFVRSRLEEEGYQVIGFSATGVADKAMEDMIATEGMFSAVIDLAPGGVGEEILGGTRAAGRERLEAAGLKGLPQVIAPCAVNLMTPPRSKYKPDYYQRKKYDLDSLRTFLRLSREELVLVAGEMARKLNLAKGPVKFLMPQRGWSSFDAEGASVYEPESDQIFAQELRRLLKDEVEIREIDANIDEPEFGKAVVEAFLELMELRGNSKYAAG